MSKKRMPGLTLKRGIWQTDKQYRYFVGGKLRKSTGYKEEQLEEAEAMLRRLMEEAKDAVERGIRPQKTFAEVIAKFLKETRKASVEQDRYHVESLLPYIGHLPLSQIHNDSLRPYIESRLLEVKKKTVTNALELVRHILRLAAGSWYHNFPNGRSMSWPESVPLISMPLVNDSKRPCPLDWDQQEELFQYLHPDLFNMCTFMVHTGVRQQDVVQLEWQWEIPVPELGISVFLVPGWVWREDKFEPDGLTKNREDRLVVLNRVAQAVVDSRRGYTLITYSPIKVIV